MSSLYWYKDNREKRKYNVTTIVSTRLAGGQIISAL